MAEKFDVPTGWVLQAYQYALDPTDAQTALLESHAGAARFAYNTMLRAVKDNLSQRAAERSYGWADTDLTPLLSWSFQSLRNDFNRRKHVVAVRDDGTPWWGENSKEAYANACKNLSSALTNWSTSRKGTRKGPRVGFPSFKSKRSTKVFAFTTGAIRIEPDRHHVTLPRLGSLRVHESTQTRPTTGARFGAGVEGHGAVRAGPLAGELHVRGRASGETARSCHTPRRRGWC